MKVERSEDMRLRASMEGYSRSGLHFFHFLFLCLNFPDIIAAASLVS